MKQTNNKQPIYDEFETRRFDLNSLQYKQYLRHRRRRLYLYPLLFLFFAGIVYYYDYQEQNKKAIISPPAQVSVKGSHISTATNATTNSTIGSDTINDSNATATKETENNTDSNSTVDSTAATITAAQQAPIFINGVRVDDKEQTNSSGVYYSKLPKFNVDGLGEVGYSTDYISFIPNVSLYKALPHCEVLTVIDGSKIACRYQDQVINLQLLGVVIPTTPDLGKEKVYAESSKQELEKILFSLNDDKQVAMQVHGKVNDSTYLSTLYTNFGANINYTLIYNGVVFANKDMDLSKNWVQQYIFAAADAEQNHRGLFNNKNWLDNQLPVYPSP